MEVKKERIKKLFPWYFSNFELPIGAREEAILVYRACKTQKCDKESFTPTFEEQGCKYFDDDDPSDPSLYSLSTYENPKHIKRFVTMNSEYKKPYKIAKGFTNPECGLVQRTRERNKNLKKSSHVDWWLYIDARPYESFQIIDDFEAYLEEYSKKKE